MPNKLFTEYYQNPFSGLDLYQDKVKELAFEGFGEQLNVNMSLPDPVNGEIHVSGAYFLTGIQEIGANVIVLDGKTEFIGLNSSENYILYTGTGSAVTGTGHSFTSMFFSYVTPNGSAFNLTGAEGRFFSSVYNGFFNQASPSKINGFEDFASIKLGRVVDGAGFEFDGAFGKVGIFDTPFENITGVEIKTLAGFDGLLALNNNYFKDVGGSHIEVVDTSNVRARITNNDFEDVEGSYFVGFDETTIGFDVQNNTNQINSGTFLDASFSGNTTPQTVTTEWSDINTDYAINYSQRVTYDSADNSFVYNGVRDSLLRAKINSYVESQSNNSNFEFGFFVDSGSGFELVEPAIPYRFRQADNTEFISASARLEVPNASRFKLRVRKPSGSSDITFLSSKAII